MKTKLLFTLLAVSSGLHVFANSSSAENNGLCCSMDESDITIFEAIKGEKLSKIESGNTVVLPFGYSNRMITLQVGLSSENDSHEFILDSGAPTFITDSVAQTHDFTLINTETAFDVNQNRQNVDKYNIRKINLGGKDIPNVKAVSSPMVDKMPLLKDHPYSGLLGANTMKNAVWMINYQKREITLLSSSDSIPQSGNAFSAPLKTDELNRPIISVNIGSDKNLCFIIDVGYNGSLLLPQKYMSKPLFNDSLTFTQSERLSSGFATAMAQMEYKFLHEISIGEAKLQDVKASTGGNNTDALIGNEFLEKYILVLDFIGQKVVFLPAKDESKNSCC